MSSTGARRRISIGSGIILCNPVGSRLCSSRRPTGGARSNARRTHDRIGSVFTLQSQVCTLWSRVTRRPLKPTKGDVVPQTGVAAWGLATACHSGPPSVSPTGAPTPELLHPPTLRSHLLCDRAHSKHRRVGQKTSRQTPKLYSKAAIDVYHDPPRGKGHKYSIRRSQASAHMRWSNSSSCSDKTRRLLRPAELPHRGTTSATATC